MTLRNRLGNLDSHLAPTILKLGEENLHAYDSPTEYMREKLADSYRALECHSRYMLALKYYLIGDGRALDEWVKIGEAVEQYFFGDWRGTFKVEITGGDPGYWKQCEWMRIFEEGLVASAVTDQWDLARRISTYPDSHCGQDVGTRPEHRALCLALAEWIRDGQLSTLGYQQLEKAQRGNHLRSREEAKLLRAALEGPAASFAAVLEVYLEYYRKKVFPLDDVTEKQSKWGTLFWHWSAARGVMPKVSEGLVDYIVRI